MFAFNSLTGAGVKKVNLGGQTVCFGTVGVKRQTG